MGPYRYANGGATVYPSMGYPPPAPASAPMQTQPYMPSQMPGGTLAPGGVNRGIGSLQTQGYQAPAFAAQPQTPQGFNPGAYPAFANSQFAMQQPQVQTPQPGQFARGGLVDAAEKLRSAGRYGDTELIHVNPEERMVLRGILGPETINPQTGLPEHFSFGSILQTLAPFANFIPGVGPIISAGMGAAGTALNASKASKASKAQEAAMSSAASAPVDRGPPLTVKPLRREAVPVTFDPFTYGQRGGQAAEFSFFRPPTAATTMTPAAAAAAAAAEGPNWASYLASNPDVMQEYQSLTGTKKGLAELGRLGVSSPEDFGRWHYGRFGQSEGRRPYREGGEADYDDDDMASHLMAYAQGGGHNGPGRVKGIGSGQDDKIPAWLSDGEYVWSAQDVADLGDGSTDEGVRRLDKMRQMVRKQAGRRDVKKIAKPQRGIDHMLKAVGGAV